MAGTSAEVLDCSFMENHADWNGGACGVNTQSTMNFEGCPFGDNTCDSGCGGVASRDGAHMDAANRLFVHNLGVDAGALRTWGAGATVSRCTFHANRSPAGVPRSEDFVLCSISPALPPNNSCGKLMGAFPEGCLDCGPIGVQTRSCGPLAQPGRAARLSRRTLVRVSMSDSVMAWLRKPTS